MLDPSDPQTKHIQAAAREMDRIRMLAQKMTVASSDTRRLLFQLTKAPIEDLLSLNAKQFDNSESIRGRIAMLAKSLLTLRNLGDSNIHIDRSDGVGDCPFCDTPITRFQPQENPTQEDPWRIYCSQCTAIYSTEMERLAAPALGFGTEKM